MHSFSSLSKFPDVEAAFPSQAGCLWDMLADTMPLQVRLRTALGSEGAATARMEYHAEVCSGYGMFVRTYRTERGAGS